MTFQRFINDIFIDYLDSFLPAFVDNLVIISNDELEHQEHVLKGVQSFLGFCNFYRHLLMYRLCFLVVYGRHDTRLHTVWM